MAVIIYPKTLDWKYMKQRPQQLMIQLGKLGHLVYFENMSHVDEQFQEVSQNVFLFSDSQRFITSILPHLRKQHNVVVWTTWAKQRTRIQIFRPDKVIYDCCDEFPQWSKYEASMIESADHVVCTAKTIQDRIALAHPQKPTTLIRNGADEVFFTSESFARPTDLPQGKIVGYIGAWAYWVDHRLMDLLSKSFPDVQFVAIGAPYGDIPSYENHENVHVLGQKPHTELISYLQHFDIALIPFQYHPITLATNPVKAYEYLAAGARVLSTALPECIAMEPYLTTATSHSDFSNKLLSHLSTTESEQCKKDRIEFARNHTWQVRGSQANHVIESVLSR